MCSTNEIKMINKKDKNPSIQQIIKQTNKKSKHEKAKKKINKKINKQKANK